MAKAKKKTTATEPKLAPVPVVIAGWELSDQAIDDMIDLTFRMFERMMKNEGLLRLIHLVNGLQSTFQ